MKLGPFVSLAGAVLTFVAVDALTADRANVVVYAGLLLAGPAWCYALAAASDEEDFDHHWPD